MKKMISVSVLCAWLLVTSSSVRAAEPGSETPEWFDKITSAAIENRLALAFDGETFSGPAWQRLVQEGQESQFFLIGEEHGIAENPMLAAQLFSTLSASGYSRLAIEISPPMATIVDEAIKNGGVESLKALFNEPGGEPAFFGLAQEAEMLVSVRAAVPASEPAFWGSDYEVLGDRQLLKQLESAEKPRNAQKPLDALIAASSASWERYAETGSPGFIFSFNGDPELVRNLKAAWPGRDPDSSLILDTLEETLEINQLWVQGKGLESNQRRAALLRTNFLRHWNGSKQDGSRPRIMAKFGASHLVRGLNSNRTFDLGSLIAELAEANGLSSFSVMVIPGKDSMTAVFDATTWSYRASKPKDNYIKGLEPVIKAAFADKFTLIDLSGIRRFVASAAKDIDPELLRVAFGYDMLLVMSGSTPSSEFQHRVDRVSNQESE